jgi:hypothetical protein
LKLGGIDVFRDFESGPHPQGGVEIILLAMARPYAAIRDPGAWTI